MTNPRSEAKARAEITRMYRDTKAFVSARKRAYIVTISASWLAIFAAFMCLRANLASSFTCTLIAVVGGVLLGIAIWMKLSIAQLPLIIKYTELRDREVDSSKSSGC